MEITVSGEIAKMLDKAKTAAQKAGIELTGDHAGGTFSGLGVEGRYSACGDALTVTVTEKPFFISDSLLEEKLRELFAP